jgi:NAD(P)H-dependent flavin oxidoreductase YrpB (nitropropane dioxygenase family)
MTTTMEFANDLLAGLRSRVHSSFGDSETRGFDWPGLHARLAAAHAARVELSRFESPSVALAGSFAAWRAAPASTGKILPGVNRTDSADGKATAGMDGVVAPEPGAGGRGIQ